MNKFIKDNKYTILAGIAVVVGVLLTYRLRAATFAKKWVGINENGFNASFSNQVFEAMLKKAGWKSGEAWCMYFAKAVHYDSFPKDRDKINTLLNGSTQRSWDNVKKDKSNTYKAITSGSPKIGDIAIWQNVNDRSKGHAGVVIKSGINDFQTVEGNTNAIGSREGDKVAIKVRPLQYGKAVGNSNLALLGFIRKVQKIF